MSFWESREEKIKQLEDANKTLFEVKEKYLKWTNMAYGALKQIEKEMYKELGKNPPYTFDEYQNRALKYANYPNVGDNLYYPALGLTGEAGECADKIKKIMRDKDGKVSEEDKTEIMKEIGDVGWYLVALCKELGCTLEECARMNIEKLEDRYNRGTIGGSGDNR